MLLHTVVHTLHTVLYSPLSANFRAHLSRPSIELSKPHKLKRAMAVMVKKKPTCRLPQLRPQTIPRLLLAARAQLCPGLVLLAAAKKCLRAPQPRGTYKPPAALHNPKNLSHLQPTLGIAAHIRHMPLTALKPKAKVWYLPAGLH